MAVAAVEGCNGWALLEAAGDCTGGRGWLGLVSHLEEAGYGCNQREGNWIGWSKGWPLL